MDNKAYDHDMDVRGTHNKVKWYFHRIYSEVDINNTIINDTIINNTIIYDDVFRPPVHQS